MRFVVNSGAGFSIIFDRPAYNLRLPHSDPSFQLVVKGLEGTDKPWLTSVKRFRLAGQDIANVNFVVAGHQATPEAIGYLGQNVLGVADTEYDLANGIIRLMSAKGCGGANLAYWVKEGSYSLLPLGYGNLGGPQFVGVATINGARVRVVFETADATSVLSLAAARRVGIRLDGPGVKPAGLAYGGVSGSSETWIAPIASFQIGDETVKNTHIRVGDIHSDFDMIIGLDFFFSHRIYVAQSQQKIYMTYNGGSVFDLTHKGPAIPAGTDGPAAPDLHALASSAKEGDASSAEPADADGYSRRAAASEARGDLDHALIDFDRAIDLAPKDVRYLQRRAILHLELHQPFLAMQDADATLKLQPGDPDMLVFRGRLRHAGNDEDGARLDADAASAAATKDSGARLKLGGLYLAMGLYPQAIAQFDAWIATHDNYTEMSQAYNGRCWARALANVELDKALSDCNAAVRAVSQPDYLDSRGLVHLRRGEFDRAIADYNAALVGKPNLFWSLYGRGLAELKTGAKAKGDADISAAAAAAPKLAEKAAKLGLTP